MYRKDFVKKTVSSLKPARFERLRDILDSEHYIPFDFVEHDKIDESILEEKISDYFEKVELLAGGKRFDCLIEEYVDDLEAVVRDHIDRNTPSLRNGRQADSRAKRYYDRAVSMKKECLKDFDKLLDYSRIMLCLYTAVINKKNKSISEMISDFDYASECLDGTEIMKALRAEKTSYMLSERKRFDTRNAYGLDRCTFILVIIMYQYIKSNEVEVEF